MRKLGPRTAHYWKLQHMLKATGTDAVSAFADGTLTSDTWAGMVERCRACSRGHGCQCFVERRAFDKAAARAPEYCRNRASMNAICAGNSEVA